MGEAAESDNVVALRDWSSRADTWMNLVTGLGVRGRDKSRHDFFAPPREFSQNELEDLYRGDAIAARIVDVPANDMVRAWWELSISTQLENEEEVDPEEANKISAHMQMRMRKLEAKQKIKRALRWDLLYGGSLLVVVADDGKGLDEPLDLNTLKKVEALHVLHRFQVSEGPLETDPTSTNFGEPTHYNISQGSIRSAEFNVVDASRVLRFQHVDLPEDTRRRTFDRFGDSVFIRCWEALSDFQMAYRAVAALVSDFAQGVWKIPHLREMATSKKESVMKRGIFAALTLVLLAVVCFASPPVEEGIEVSAPSPQWDLPETQGILVAEKTEAEMWSEAQDDISLSSQSSTMVSSGPTIPCLLSFCKKTGVRCDLIGPKTLPNGTECCEYQCFSDPDCDVQGVNRPGNACPGT